MTKQKKEKTIADQMADLNMAFMLKTKGKLNLRGAAQNLTDTLISAYEKNGDLRQEAIKKAEALMITPEYLDKSTSLTAINNWWYGGRQIYRFDEELTAALVKQSKSDLNLEAIVLEQLPIKDFFIERFIEEKESYGFFFSIVDVDRYILISEIFQGGITKSYMLGLDYGTSISEIIDNTINRGIEENNFSEEAIAQYKSLSTALIHEFTEKMQFVLYMAAVNADIEAVTNGAVIHKTTQNKIPKHSKTEVANVGYRFGATIRAEKNAPRIIYNGEHEKGSSKSPHIRRSHFHSYWIGSGENKELIVKWVNTVFVNGGVDNVSTIHKVEGKK